MNKLDRLVCWFRLMNAFVSVCQTVRVLHQITAKNKNNGQNKQDHEHNENAETDKNSW